MNRKAGIALGAFLAGCACSHVASQLVVPPARAGTTPPRWEYACFGDGYEIQDLTKYLNWFGAQGWELVGGWPQVGTRVCLKRPLP